MAFDIDQEHPEYVAKKAAWRRYRDLYAGGEQFRVNAAEYLIPRQREPGEVYAERLCRIFYENYVGSIVDWYAATLFRREPVITFEGNDDASRTFFGAMVEDCDRRGTSLADFFRRQFTESLVTGTSYVLVDFPRVKTRPGTRGEEDASGASRAYLVEYGADDVINWSLDEYGNFEWVVIRTKQIKKDRVEDAEWRTETKWSYYDKRTYRIYGEDGVIDQGNHALAKLGQTPLFALRIPEGLWMLNRAGSLQLEHFNKSNALSWALTMGLFAMPVVYSDREWSQMVGESYYIQLGPQDRFGWTEPEGKVYQIAADNLVRLREEIYRVCYPAEPSSANFDYTIVPGHLGQVWMGAPESRFFTLTAAQLTMTNGIAQRLQEFGSDFARCITAGERTVRLNFKIFEHDDAQTKGLYQAARQRSPIGVMLQLGEQPGQLFGAYMPAMVPEVPEFDDGETRLQWAFHNDRAQGTVDDELYIAFG